MARSTPADYREFIRLSVDLPDNPKLATIDDPAAGWAYVVAVCYCGRNLTDGVFPLAPVVRQAGVKQSAARSLIEAGMWHVAGHECERCIQPGPGKALVHDYLEHQRSSDEAKALRDARREAGRRGAHSRWSSDSGGKSHSNSHGKSDGNDVADAWQDDDKPMAEGEEEVKKTTSSSRSREPQRDDVDQLCALIVDHAERYEGRRPTVSEAWRRSLRLLLDSDLAAESDPLALALRVFEFMQQDDFWPPNVRSAPTFRKKFAQIRAKARHQWERQNKPRPGQRTRDDKRAAVGSVVAEVFGTAALRPDLRSIQGGQP